MGKKILLLAGSPRKGGNSDLLCDAFAEGARESGHSTEKIYVHDHNIGYCRACYGCRGEGACVQQDSMAGRYYGKDGGGGCDRSGHAGLFLLHGRPAENADRPHAAPLYGDSPQGFLFLSPQPPRVSGLWSAPWRR